MDNLKTALVEYLKGSYEVVPFKGQSLFTVNCRALAYLRYSRDLGGKFYFGVTESEFRRYSSNNLYVLLICGSVEKTVVLPAVDFEGLVRGSRIASGQWKLNIDVERDKLLLRVSGKGKFDVTEYLNDFDFSPKEHKRVRLSPLLLPPKDRREKTEVPIAPHEALKAELAESAKDSDHPERFEEALVKFFNFIGLTARRIGGPGDTNILIDFPKRIIVDGKSTRAPSVAHINFTRIKQHMLANDAEAMLVVSRGFQPAVVRDAAVESAGLITVDSLQKILELYHTMPGSPFEYAEVFSSKGLISEVQIDIPLKNSQQQISEWFAKALAVSAVMDFELRNADEIKGRLDLTMQQRGEGLLPRSELEEILHAMSKRPFNVILRVNSKYRALFHSWQVRERIAGALRLSYNQ